MKDDPRSGRPHARPTAPPGGDRAAKPRLSSGAEFAGLGLQFAGAMGLFGFLGWWLDGRLGTGPWLLILMIFVGAGAAFYSMYRRVFGTARPTGTGSRGARREEEDRR